jgi:hypothetical protein
MSSDESPPPAKESSRSKATQRNNKNSGKKEESVDKLPVRRSYDLNLPRFLIQALLEKNKVPLPVEQVQLAIVLQDKK